MDSVLDCRSSVPGLSPGREYCVVVLGKTLYSLTSCTNGKGRLKELSIDVSFSRPRSLMLMSKLLLKSSFKWIAFQHE